MPPIKYIHQTPKPLFVAAFLLVCSLALALLSGCTGADASEQPSAAHLYAKQEQRRAVAAAQACGPGYAAVWHDTTEMQCVREVNP